MIPGIFEVDMFFYVHIVLIVFIIVLLFTCVIFQLSVSTVSDGLVGPNQTNTTLPHSYNSRHCPTISGASGFRYDPTGH